MLIFPSGTVVFEAGAELTRADQTGFVGGLLLSVLPLATVDTIEQHGIRPPGGDYPAEYDRLTIMRGAALPRRLGL